MKFAILLLGALAATVFADHKDEPQIPEPVMAAMPDLNQINNMFGGQMPKIPAGMKIDDLKDAFYNMPPAMKAKLNEMAESMGVKYDEIEDALNNPPEKLKEMFENGGANAAADGMFTVPNAENTEQAQPGAGPNMADMLKNIDMGAMGDMMKNVDISGMMKDMDMGAMGDMMKNVDIQGMMKNMDMGAMGDMMKNVDIQGLMKNMDMGAMGDMMKNVDVQGLMKNMDMGAMGDMMKNVDISGMMKNMDMGAMGNMMKNVDINGMMKGMDLGPMGNMLKNVDIQGMMKNMDLGAMGDMMKNVDIQGMMKNMDMGAMGDMMKNVDIEGMMKGMDMGPMGSILKGMDMKTITGLMKNVDVGMLQGMMKHMDLGPMGNMVKNMDLGAVSRVMKHMDMGAVTDIMKGKMPSLGAIKAMAGIPEGAGLKDMGGIVKEKMEALGIPTDNPMEAIAAISEKMKMLPLPEGMDPSVMLNQLHGELEAMGLPEDPSKMKDFLLEKLGLPEGIKHISELRNPEVMAQMMQRNVFKMMGIDENESPDVVKDRIIDQLVEEAEKMGAEFPKDASREELMTEMDKMLSNKLNDIVGLETESIMPNKLIAAAKSKLANLGLNDFGSIKKHVMDMAMKQLMKKVTAMVMHKMMPGKHESQMPPRMPHHQMMMPPQMMMNPHMMNPHMMMPPHMMRPQPIDLDLAIEINLEQQAQQPTQVQVPSYLRGVEHAVGHPELEDMDDEQLFHHIMAVREGLRSGEMAEEVLQEMIEDLMQARLRARVMSVRNMFLNDRLAAMQKEMEMMRAPRPAAPVPARAPTSNLLQALMGERVV